MLARQGLVQPQATLPPPDADVRELFLRGEPLAKQSQVKPFFPSLVHAG